MGGIITIGEYVGYYQPAVAALLRAMARTVIVQWPRTRREWERIMQEPPRPGRAGVA